MIFIQRQGTTGTVNYTGDTARILNASGQIIANWTAGGTIVNVPQGGGYVLQVSTGGVVVSQSLAIGVIVESMGQSNMANWYHEPTAQAGGALTYQLQADGTWGAVTGPGAISFADTLSKALGVPVAMINAAVSGTALLSTTNPTTNWSQSGTGTLYGNALAQLVQAGGSAEYMLWAQGEADAGDVVRTDGVAAYAQALGALMARMGTDFGDPSILIQQVSTASGSGAPIASAQQQVVDAMTNVSFGTTMAGLAPTERGHFDGPSYAFAAKQMATTALAELGIYIAAPVQYGTPGNDSLRGVTGGSLIYACDGDDRIDASAQDDEFFGGAGNDTLLGRLGNDLLFGGDGNDSLSGGNGNDGLSGGAGDDVLDGGAGNDDLWGTFGNDTLLGGDGNDVLNGGTGTNILDGGAGIDTLSYLLMSTDGVTVDLAVTVAQNTGFSLDMITNVENVSGSSHADFLSGNAGDNVLDGGDGNDILNGRDGNDTLVGGDGKDTLDGGLGNDILDGSADARGDLFTFSTALGASNIDQIVNFSSGLDNIYLSHDIFSAFAIGNIKAGALVIGVEAITAGQHLIYNPTDGALSYDADGAGGQAAQQFAILVGAPPVIVPKDFKVF